VGAVARDAGTPPYNPDPVILPHHSCQRSRL